MARVFFYAKPGCVNNIRQQELLRQAGHTLTVVDLLQYPWQAEPEKLRSFFANLPVAEWFNRSAPAIKNGTVLPESLHAEQAIAAMLADPLLIRRPLLEVAGRRRAGFDLPTITEWLAIDANATDDLETCAKLRQVKDASA